MIYTFELVDADDAALTWFVEQHVNPSRIARGETPFLTNQAYIESRMRELLAPVRANYDSADASALLTQYKAATLAERAAAKAALGL